MNNLSKKSQTFMKMFDMKYPIIQAGMDGAATPTLVSAVTNAGGMGTIPLGFREPELALKQIEAIEQTTTGYYMSNFVLNFAALSLSTALAHGHKMKAILFSWGLPTPYMLQLIKEKNKLYGVQVSDKLGAERALLLDPKPDFLVCQGIEAGGHVQANKPLADALKEILDVTKDLPVVAAGGISTGADISKWLQLGAAAVIMGTRFVATQESEAHETYKQEIVKTQSASDTVLTVCLNKIWPNATHRLLRSNQTFQMWESNGRPAGPLDVSGGVLDGNRPGEYDIIALDANGNTTWERYVDVVPVQSMRYCDVNALGTFAGEGVGNINDIPSVDTLIKRLVSDYNSIEEK